MPKPIDWMRAKWAALSRLGADSPTPYLPMTSPDTELVLPVASQEAKMVEANLNKRPSDTDALARDTARY